MMELRRNIRAHNDARRRAEELSAIEQKKLVESYKLHLEEKRRAMKEANDQLREPFRRAAERRAALEWQLSQETAVRAAQVRHGADTAVAAADAAQTQRPESAATSHSEASWVDPFVVEEEAAMRPGGARSTGMARQKPRVLTGDHAEESHAAPSASRSVRTGASTARGPGERSPREPPPARGPGGTMSFKSPAIIDTMIAAVESGSRAWLGPPPAEKEPTVEEAAVEGSTKGFASTGGTFHNIARRRRLRMMHSIATQVLSGRQPIGAPAAGHPLPARFEGRRFADTAPMM